MVTRKTRNYKEKKPMTTFGQFILPLTVIMALALLFFSVKLFFFNPNDAGLVEEPRQTAEERPAHTALEKTPDEKPASDTSAVDVPMANPVEETDKKEAPKQETVKKEPVKKEPVKKEPVKKDPVKKEPVKQEPAKPQPAKADVQRWDVQIGAFSAKDNATALAQKVKSEGYETYVSETVSGGKPFYRVRVKGAKTREETQKTANVLLGKQYEIFLVEIK